MDKHESLRVIEEMIATAKSEVQEDGFLFLSWGYLVLAASLANFGLMEFTGFRMPWLPWPVLMTLGVVVQMIYLVRKEKKARSRSVIERWLGFLWSGFFISLLLLGFVGYREFMIDHEIRFTYGLILVLYGLATYVSGGALKFKPLIIGGVFCWFCAIGAFFVEFQFQLLLIGVAVLISWVIPGHLLMVQKKQNAV